MARSRPPVPRLAAVALLAVVTTTLPAAASLTGYGPVGPDPATRLGMSAPVLTAEVGGPSGSLVTADLADGTASVSRPDGYSAGSQIVSITDLSGPGVAEALLPAGMLTGVDVVLGVGVGVRDVETAGASDGVQGRGLRGRGASAVPSPLAAVAAAVPSDALSVVLRSPSLVGATVVVVDDGTEVTVSTGSTVTLALDGPAAIFALQPTDQGTDEPSGDGEPAAAPAPTDDDAQAAAAGGPDDGAPGGNGTAALVLLGLLAAVAALLTVARVRGSRPRPSRP